VITYTVGWSASAVRDLDRVPLKAVDAIATFVHGPLSEQPFRVGKPLGGDLLGRRTARRGPFRIIYSIDETSHTLTIHAVGHRSDVYRRP
jgi:mRNA-degrading endonuclease RelE of RelBE toxin-antitoxin system